VPDNVKFCAEEFKLKAILMNNDIFENIKREIFIGLSGKFVQILKEN